MRTIILLIVILFSLGCTSKPKEEIKSDSKAFSLETIPKLHDEKYTVQFVDRIIPNPLRTYIVQAEDNKPLQLLRLEQYPLLYLYDGEQSSAFSFKVTHYGGEREDECSNIYSALAGLKIEKDKVLLNYALFVWSYDEEFLTRLGNGLLEEDDFSDGALRALTSKGKELLKAKGNLGEWFILNESPEGSYLIQTLVRVLPPKKG